MWDDSICIISRLFIMLLHKIPVTPTLASNVSNLCIKGNEELYHNWYLSKITPDLVPEPYQI